MYDTIKKGTLKCTHYFKIKKSLAATYFPAKAVSSAQESLTSVFGMGTGITSPLWPPGKINKLKTGGRNEDKKMEGTIIWPSLTTC